MLLGGEIVYEDNSTCLTGRKNTRKMGRQNQH